MLLFIGQVDHSCIKWVHRYVLNVGLLAVINISSECIWCISHLAQHNLVLGLHVSGMHTRFVNVTLLYWDTVIAIVKVHVRKNRCSVKHGEYLCSKWQGICDYHCGWKDNLVLWTEPLSAVLLLCNDDRCFCGHQSWLHESTGMAGFDVGIGYSHWLILHMLADWAIRWVEAGLQFDHTDNGPA